MKTILVIEDESVIANMLSDLLNDEGYQVMVALNGAEGLRCLEQAIPDMIITDIMMPIMDGLTFCREVQAHPTYQHIPIIILSAVSDRSKIVDCDFAGIIDKPFNIDDLLNVTAHVLTALH